MLSLTRILNTLPFLLVCLCCGVQNGVPAITLNASRETLGAVTTVTAFDAGQSQFIEGLAIDKEGNVYTTIFLTGQIWRMTPRGEQSILATLDIGSSGGILVGLAADAEGNLYVCDASHEPATHGIWKVNRSGKARLFAALDPSGFPNGIAVDHAGTLFVTDSLLGLIWRISKTGEARVWLKDPLLAPLIGPLGVGANGIEFESGDLFVANTDQGTIVRIELEGDTPRDVKVFVQDSVLVGADGIAFDVRHNLYVAINFQNTLVRISPERDIRTLATSRDGLDFPASTSFGQRYGQRKVLFWTNAGVNLGTPSIQKLEVGIPGVPLP